MKSSHIDFAPRTLRRALFLTRPATWAFAAIGIVLCTVAALSTARMIEQRNTQQLRLDWINAQLSERSASKPEQKKSTISESQAAAVNAAIAQLNLPWGALFDALEAATPNSIAFVSLEPDSKKSTIRGVAEAKNSDDMIAYIERLKQQDFFTDVVLTKHETNQQDTNSPLRFQFEAQWGKLQ